MKRSIPVLIMAAFFIWCGAPGAGAFCTSNAECPEGSYCAKEAGDCDGVGECREKPQYCPFVRAPVCGCDGRTYYNACLAAAAGVNVAYGGECTTPPPPCKDNGECPEGYYCAKEPGDCDGVGECREKPQYCPDVVDPVCGCDGQTYGNACEAAAAGVNVAYKGVCMPPPCKDNNECPTGHYCAKAVGDCDGVGECEEKPTACAEIYRPVCGCDGRTYDNACFAAAAGVNIAFTGECTTPPPCRDNNECREGYYCAKAVGDCDGVGECREKPQYCSDVVDAVCGCDGRTYSNACYAAMAGVNVAYEGRCAPARCRDNTNCRAGYYCAKAVGDCDGVGECKERPTACVEIWDPVCGCDGKTYGNACFAAMAGVNVESTGVCPPPGPTIVMLDPRVMDDDVHTGESGVDKLMILWSEGVVFGANDVSIENEEGAAVGFTLSASNSEIMVITFNEELIHDSYTITIEDSVVSTATGLAIDGDENGVAGSDAVILMEHRKRTDTDDNDKIDFYDLAKLAEEWLWED